MKRVLVLGDVIIDEYNHGKRLGLSAETPTIVAKQDRVETFVGGAGLVCRHLLRLGCEVYLKSVRGYSKDFADMLKESDDPPSIKEMDVFWDFSMAIPDWQVTTKRRFFVEGYKLLQFDVLNDRPFMYEDEDEFIEKTLKTIRVHAIDSVIICDNRHGLSSLWERISFRIKSIKDKRPKLFVDSQFSQKESDANNFCSDVRLLNEREFAEIINVSPADIILTDEDTWLHELADHDLCSDIILKKGAAGSKMCFRDSRVIITTPALSDVDVVDTCGAGDAFLGALVSCESNSWDDRLADANRWAGLSTIYMGTIVPKREQ